MKFFKRILATVLVLVGIILWYVVFTSECVSAQEFDFNIVLVFLGSSCIGAGTGIASKT